MSWDLFVQDIPRDVQDVREIPDDFEPQSLGRRSEIVEQIVAVVPTADFSDPSWGSVEGEICSLEFSMGVDEDVHSFTIHVHGGGGAAGLVVELLGRYGWRAIDPASDTGIFDPGSAPASLEKWRGYRDRVVGSTEEDGSPAT